MKISLITATYNSAATLRDTFDSVLMQTHDDIEYWVIDGGSKDNTICIIKEYEPKFNGRMLWISEPDNGIYDAMNKGISMASGDIVGILNSDDFFFDKNVLEEINNAFTKCDTDCIFGNLVYVDADNTDIVQRIWKGSEYKEGRFKYGWVPAHPTFYVRRECYEKYGCYDLSYQVSADFELMMRFLAKYKIKSYYLDKYIVRMRAGGESNGSLKNILLGNHNIMRAFKENRVAAAPLYPVFRLLPKIVQRFRIKCMSLLGVKPNLK